MIEPGPVDELAAGIDVLTAGDFIPGSDPSTNEAAAVSRARREGDEARASAGRRRP